LRAKFVQLKRSLSIQELPKVEVEKIEGLKNAINKLQQELTQQKLITDTISEGNIAMKNENMDLKQRIGRTEQKLSDLDKAVHEILEQTG